MCPNCSGRGASRRGLPLEHLGLLLLEDQENVDPVRRSTPDVLPEECGGEGRPRWVKSHAHTIPTARRHAAGAPSLDGSTCHVTDGGCENSCCAVVKLAALRVRGAAPEEAAAAHPSRMWLPGHRGVRGLAGRWQPRKEARIEDARPPCEMRGTTPKSRGHCGRETDGSRKSTCRARAKRTRDDEIRRQSSRTTLQPAAVSHLPLAS